jgi:hypothetical protein
MDLILTTTIQDTIASLLKDPDFHTTERKEAERITEVSLPAKDNVAVSYTLIHDVSLHLNTKSRGKGKPTKTNFPPLCIDILY